MKGKAAIYYEGAKEFAIEEIEVADPKEGEVRVKMIATGLCHSDYHMITGEYGPIPTPVIGGHEGAGIVEKVGPGVTDLKVGDHILTAFLPACGKCMYCAMGRSNLCDVGAGVLAGNQVDGTKRSKSNKSGQELGQFCMLGTFANYAVLPLMSCIKLHPDMKMEKACLMGCCVPTGFGSATKSAGTLVGEVVVVYGIGGVGANALQGAAIAGARMVIAVDPVPFKREIATQFGATHTIDPSKEDVLAKVMELTYNRGADRAVMTIGNPTPEDVALATRSTRKGGRTVLTSVMHAVKYQSLPINGFEFTLLGKELKGALFGDSTFRDDIPRLLEMYSAGKLKVDELTTRTYKLEELNKGYQDMLDGKNIRGVVIHSH